MEEGYDINELDVKKFKNIKLTREIKQNLSNSIDGSYSLQKYEGRNIYAIKKGRNFNIIASKNLYQSIIDALNGGEEKKELIKSKLSLTQLLNKKTFEKDLLIYGLKNLNYLKKNISTDLILKYFKDYIYHSHSGNYLINFDNIFLKIERNHLNNGRSTISTFYDAETDKFNYDFFLNDMELLKFTYKPDEKILAAITARQHFLYDYALYDLCLKYIRKMKITGGKLGYDILHPVFDNPIFELNAENLKIFNKESFDSILREILSNEDVSHGILRYSILEYNDITYNFFDFNAEFELELKYKSGAGIFNTRGYTTINNFLQEYESVNKDIDKYLKMKMPENARGSISVNFTELLNQSHVTSAYAAENDQNEFKKQINTLKKKYDNLYTYFNDIKDIKQTKEHIKLIAVIILNIASHNDLNINLDIKKLLDKPVISDLSKDIKEVEKIFKNVKSVDDILKERLKKLTRARLEFVNRDLERYRDYIINNDDYIKYIEKEYERETNIDKWINNNKRDLQIFGQFFTGKKMASEFINFIFDGKWNRQNLNYDSATFLEPTNGTGRLSLELTRYHLNAYGKYKNPLVLHTNELQKKLNDDFLDKFNKIKIDKSLKHINTNKDYIREKIMPNDSVDVCFANPPFGLYLDHKSLNKKDYKILKGGGFSKMEFLSFSRMYDSAKDDGDIFLIVPAGFEDKIKSHTTLIEDKDYTIQHKINNLNFEGIGITVSFLMININKEVKEVKEVKAIEVIKRAIKKTKVEKNASKKKEILEKTISELAKMIGPYDTRVSNQLKKLSKKELESFYNDKLITKITYGKKNIYLYKKTIILGKKAYKLITDLDDKKKYFKDKLYDNKNTLDASIGKISKGKTKTYESHKFIKSRAYNVKDLSDDYKGLYYKDSIEPINLIKDDKVYTIKGDISKRDREYINEAESWEMYGLKQKLK